MGSVSGNETDNELNIHEVDERELSYDEEWAVAVGLVCKDILPESWMFEKEVTLSQLCTILRRFVQYYIYGE